MPMQDPLDGGQPDAGPLELLPRVEALKRAEHLVGVTGIEACAVVAHVDRAPPVLIGDAELDRGPRMLARELPRVRHQVLDHRAQQPRIAVDDDPFLDADVDVAIRFALPQSFRDPSARAARDRPLRDRDRRVESATSPAVRRPAPASGRTRRGSSGCSRAPCHRAAGRTPRSAPACAIDYPLFNGSVRGLADRIAQNESEQARQATALTDSDFDTLLRRLRRSLARERRERADANAVERHADGHQSRVPSCCARGRSATSPRRSGRRARSPSDRASSTSSCGSSTPRRSFVNMLTSRSSRRSS